MRRPNRDERQQQAPRRHLRRGTGPTIRLYHFTAHAWWNIIQHEGIIRGDVPTSMLETSQYPNLTSDPDPDHQEWADGCLLNKTAVRIAIDFREDDPRLVPFRDMANRIGMDRAWHRSLTDSGGHRARNWYVHLGPIRPTRFALIEANGDPDLSDDAMIGGFMGARRYADVKPGIVFSAGYDGTSQAIYTMTGEGAKLPMRAG